MATAKPGDIYKASLKERTKNVEGALRVWWCPQVPGTSFNWPVADLEQASQLLDALAAYDDFQFANKIKGDYCNAGGIEWRHPKATGGEWWGIDPDDEDEMAHEGEAIAKARDIPKGK